MSTIATAATQRFRVLHIATPGEMVFIRHVHDSISKICAAHTNSTERLRVKFRSAGRPGSLRVSMREFLMKL